MSQPPAVRSSRFPFVPIMLEVRGRQISIEALLDTGFDGHVAVPSHLLGNGPLQQPDGYAQWRLADGSIVSAPLYAGRVRIGQMGPYLATVTVLGDEPIIGVGVAAHFTITLNRGQEVIISA